MRYPRLSGSCLMMLIIIALISSCSTPKNITYFQDSNEIAEMTVAKVNEIRVKPGDKLSIIVNSSDLDLTNQFNLPVVSQRIGYSNSSALTNSQQISCYNVDDNGDIDFPVLGYVNVEGLKRAEIARKIKEKLIGERLVMDPVVTVEFANLYYSVLGEVARPGAYDIEHDQVTLLDAISKAGDLTILGERENVTVLREVDGVRKTYHVNLTSLENVYTSPVYYLQQKDIVYVSPNENRIRQSTVNGNNVRSTAFWVSIGSLLTSVAVLITNILK